MFFKTFFFIYGLTNWRFVTPTRRKFDKRGSTASFSAYLSDLSQQCCIFLGPGDLRAGSKRPFVTAFSTKINHSVFSFLPKTCPTFEITLGELPSIQNARVPTVNKIYGCRRPTCSPLANRFAWMASVEFDHRDDGMGSVRSSKIGKMLSPSLCCLFLLTV